MVHYEANLTHSIMIINLAYESIPKFKAERRVQFASMLKQVCQAKIVQENELHGFFKFVHNFYQSDF